VLVPAAEFQGFFSDLLTDIAQMLVDALPDEVPPPLSEVLKHAMERDRVVDFGNPDATTLRRDLFRFDMQARTLLAGDDRGGRGLLNRLDQVIGVRNRLAHGAGSVSELGPGGDRLEAATVDEWSRDIDRLATILDNAVASHPSAGLSINWSERSPHGFGETARRPRSAAAHPG